MFPGMLDTWFYGKNSADYFSYMVEVPGNQFFWEMYQKRDSKDFGKQSFVQFEEFFCYTISGVGSLKGNIIF